MEVEGLKRGLTFLEERGLQTKRLVTDRHIQVKKYPREQKPQIDHRFDVWHIAKSLFGRLIIILALPTVMHAVHHQGILVTQ